MAGRRLAELQRSAVCEVVRPNSTSAVDALPTKAEQMDAWWIIGDERIRECGQKTVYIQVIVVFDFFKKKLRKFNSIFFGNNLNEF